MPRASTSRWEKTRPLRSITLTLRRKLASSISCSTGDGLPMEPAPTILAPISHVRSLTSTCPSYSDIPNLKTSKYGYGALDRYQPSDGRGISFVREVGDSRSQDRFHGSRRPMDGRFLSSGSQECG